MMRRRTENCEPAAASGHWPEPVGNRMHAICVKPSHTQMFPRVPYEGVLVARTSLTPKD